MNPQMVYFVVPRIHRTGGYERQAITLAQTLRRHDIPLKVLADSKPSILLEDCHTITARSIGGTYAVFHREFANAHAKGPVVVHLHALYRFSAAGLMAALRLRLPTVLKLPSSTDVQLLFRSRRLPVRLFQPALQRIDRFICPSRVIAEQLRPHLRRPEAAVYLPNGVDTRRFRRSSIEEQRWQREHLGIRFRQVILYVGRHVALKGGDILLKAFAQARSSLPADTGLILLGAGEQTDAWKTLAAELGVAREVLFVDTYIEPEHYYQAADAFILPSWEEGMPNTLLEAMACGLPCIASDTGGIRDILANRFPGQLVSPGNVDALARGLVGLLQPSAAGIGEQMHAHVEAYFSMDVISEQLIKLYEELR